MPAPAFLAATLLQGILLKPQDAEQIGVVAEHAPFYPCELVAERLGDTAWQNLGVHATPGGSSIATVKALMRWCARDCGSVSNPFWRELPEIQTPPYVGISSQTSCADSARRGDDEVSEMIDAEFVELLWPAPCGGRTRDEIDRAPILDIVHEVHYSISSK